MPKLKTQLLTTIKKLTRTLAARALVRYCTRPITRELITDLTQQLFKPKQKHKTKVLPRKLSGQKNCVQNSTTQTNETDSTKNKTENNLMNTNPNQNTKLQQIESATLEFALARQRLHTLVADLHAQIEQLKLARHATLHAATSELAQRQEELRALLAASPELFVKPRTATFHGIKVGWQKGKGAIEFTDPDRVVTLIHRHYDDAEATALLHITERPDKEALAKLSVTQLRKLACTVTETGDQIVIRPMENEYQTTTFPPTVTNLNHLRTIPPNPQSRLTPRSRPACGISRRKPAERRFPNRPAQLTRRNLPGDSSFPKSPLPVFPLVIVLAVVLRPRLSSLGYQRLAIGYFTSVSSVPSCFITLLRHLPLSCLSRLSWLKISPSHFSHSLTFSPHLRFPPKIP